MILGFQPSWYLAATFFPQAEKADALHVPKTRTWSKEWGETHQPKHILGPWPGRNADRTHYASVLCLFLVTSVLYCRRLPLYLLKGCSPASSKDGYSMVFPIKFDPDFRERLHDIQWLLGQMSRCIWVWQNLDFCCSMSQQQAVYHHQTVICYLDAAQVVIFIMRVTQHLEGYLKIRSESASSHWMPCNSFWGVPLSDRSRNPGVVSVSRKA